MQALPQTLSCRCTHQAHGFTLVELLVALMLLSLIALGLGGAMRTISQTQERVDTRTERAERQQSAVRFLRQVFSQVSGLRRPSDQVRTGESSTYFVGLAQEVQWLGSMPANYGSGGRSHMRLSLQPGPYGNQLVLQYKNFEKNAKNIDWASAGSYVLDSGVEAFTIRYLRTNSATGQQWLPAWQGLEGSNATRELPSAIQLQVQTREGAWPLLVIALHQPQVNNSLLRSGPVFGGTSQ